LPEWQEGVGTLKFAVFSIIWVLEPNRRKNEEICFFFVCDYCPFGFAHLRPAGRKRQATTEAPAVTTAAPAPANPEVILATTTSTRDSGLLDYLLPMFEQQTGYKVKMIAVGTGEALKMGQEGNADVLLVHAPASEKTYMEGGYGKERLLVMHNDFIIVGPADDPAKIKSSANSKEAFTAIANAKALFISRGDDSGTNKAELTLWKSAGITPEGDWYIKTGQGMGDTLRIASEKAGYTLTDRATYLALKDTLNLTFFTKGMLRCSISIT